MTIIFVVIGLFLCLLAHRNTQLRRAEKTRRIAVATALMALGLQLPGAAIFNQPEVHRRCAATFDNR